MAKLLLAYYPHMIIAITILYFLAGIAALLDRRWPTALMLLGPVIINIGILWSLK